MNLIDRMQLEASYRINQRIEDVSEALIARVSLWEFEGFINEVDETEIVSSALKRRGYLKYGNLYTKGFSVFEIKTMPDKKTKIDEVRAWIDIPGKETKSQIIKKSFVTGVIIMANYYERI